MWREQKEEAEADSKYAEILKNHREDSYQAHALLKALDPVSNPYFLSHGTFSGA